jgi:predicted DNA-binding transcriptional regulator YafY
VGRRDGELRTYRVSRIKKVTTLEDEFERPVDFDLTRHWNASVASYEAQVPPVDVVVHASDSGMRELRWMMRGYGRTIKHTAPLDNNWVRCELAFESLGDAYVDIMRLGADVEVLEPADLRERVATAVRAMATLYN